MYELELTNACYKLLHDMFDLQPGESLAITCDTECTSTCTKLLWWITLACT